MFCTTHPRHSDKMSNAYPSVDESRDRLRCAGWSLGETCFGLVWQVDGTNGENRILATGTSQAETWWRACLQAREAGALARSRETSGEARPRPC
jgi:hypothetical protein